MRFIMPESVHTTVKFDGPALAGKSMDVSHLAPALLSLSDVVKAANTVANGEKAGIKILVNANLEQKCFELNIELVLTAWEQAKLLIAEANLATPKEIAEWIGISDGPSLGLYQLLKWLRGKKVESVSEVKITDGTLELEIRVEGESAPKTVKKIAYQLYADISTRQKALEVLNPLRNEGYDSLQFYRDKNVFAEFSKDDVPERDGSDLPEVTPQNLHKSNIRTLVRIRKAAYEGTSKWTLVYKRAVEASIEDAEWLKRFQENQELAPPGSSLDVNMQEVYTTNEDGEMVGEPSYRVIKVHKVILPLKQTSFTETLEPET